MDYLETKARQSRIAEAFWTGFMVGLSFAGGLWALVEAYLKFVGR